MHLEKLFHLTKWIQSHDPAFEVWLNHSHPKSRKKDLFHSIQEEIDFSSADLFRSMNSSAQSMSYIKKELEVTIIAYFSTWRNLNGEYLKTCIWLGCLEHAQTIFENLAMSQVYEKQKYLLYMLGEEIELATKVDLNEKGLLDHPSLLLMHQGLNKAFSLVKKSRAILRNGPTHRQSVLEQLALFFDSQEYIPLRKEYLGIKLKVFYFRLKENITEATHFQYKLTKLVLNAQHPPLYFQPVIEISQSIKMANLIGDLENAAHFSSIFLNYNPASISETQQLKTELPYCIITTGYSNLNATFLKRGISFFKSHIKHFSKEQKQTLLLTSIIGFLYTHKYQQAIDCVKLFFELKLKSKYPYTWIIEIIELISLILLDNAFMAELLYDRLRLRRTSHSYMKFILSSLKEMNLDQNNITPFLVKKILAKQDELPSYQDKERHLSIFNFGIFLLSISEEKSIHEYSKSSVPTRKDLLAYN